MFAEQLQNEDVSLTFCINTFKTVKNNVISGLLANVSVHPSMSLIQINICLN